MRKEVLTRDVTWGRGASTPAARRRERRHRRSPGARCWLAQQSAMIRCGSGGAQHGHLTVRRMGIHVHLLSARVGAAMKTYLYENGETFERERNEPAPRSIVELLRYVRSFRRMHQGTSDPGVERSGSASGSQEQSGWGREPGRVGRGDRMRPVRRIVNSTRTGSRKFGPISVPPIH